MSAAQSSEPEKQQSAIPACRRECLVRGSETLVEGNLRVVKLARLFAPAAEATQAGVSCSWSIETRLCWLQYRPRKRRQLFGA